MMSYNCISKCELSLSCMEWFKDLNLNQQTQQGFKMTAEPKYQIKRLSQKQVESLKEKIDEIVILKYQKSHSKTKNKAKIYIKLLDKFFKEIDAEFFDSIPKHRYNEALEWLDSTHHMYTPRAKKEKKVIDPSLLEQADNIYKRAKEELKMHKFKVLNFAYLNLGLPERINDLKKLNNEQLEKLKEALFTQNAFKFIL